MSSMSGYESEEMVKYGVSLDSSTSDTVKLLSDMKSEDIDSSTYLPTVECQMSMISEVAIPRCTCSTYVCHSPITFSEDAQGASGANSNREDNVEVPFNVASIVPAIKEGGNCGSHVIMRGCNIKQFNGKDISHCNDVSCGNASEGIIVQQSFVKGHPTSCYGNSSLVNNSVQKAMPQSDLDIIEDKHVLPSSVNIQSTESGCHVLGHPKSHSRNPLSVKNSVKDPLSEEQTGPPLSTNIQFGESTCQLPDHLVGESEKHQLNNGSAGFSVDRSGVLERGSVLDIDGPILDKVCVSGPDHAVYHDEGDIMFPFCPPKDERGNPSSSFENDNKDNGYHHPVDKNVLHVTRQGFIDQETTNCVGNVEKDNEKHEKVEKCFGVSEGKSHKGVLMKSVVRGVTLAGVVFFLFNLRRKNGKENVDDSSLSIQLRKSIHAEQAKQNGKKNGRSHGIYPGNKLRFQD